MTKAFHIFNRMLADKKGHNELGFAPYMVLASLVGFVVMRIRLLVQKKKA